MDPVCKPAATQAEREECNISNVKSAPDAIMRMRLPELEDEQHGSIRDTERALSRESAAVGLISATGTNVRHFPPPAWAIEAFTEATEKKPAVTPFRGDSDVIQALSQNIGATLQLGTSPDEIIITPGTQSALFLALSSLISPGDLVILPDPDYLYTERIIRYLGGIVCRVPLRVTDDGLVLDRPEFERLSKQGPVLMVFTNPNNPIGRIIQEAELEYISDMARRYNFMILVDELYCRLTYERTTFPHIANLPGMRDRTITLLGPSKTESMSGYRIGIAIAPPELIERMEDLQICIALRAPAYAQSLLTRWLADDHDWIESRRTAFRQLRDQTVARLRQSDVIEQPDVDSTAYVFPKLAFEHDSNALVRKLKRESGVVVNPGRPFGPSGQQHLRLCYAQEAGPWMAALDKMIEIIESVAQDPLSNQTFDQAVPTNERD
jgi:aspartate/methionine/tyrosine aminotransferase